MSRTLAVAVALALSLAVAPAAFAIPADLNTPTTTPQVTLHSGPPTWPAHPQPLHAPVAVATTAGEGFDELLRALPTPPRRGAELPRGVNGRARVEPRSEQGQSCRVLCLQWVLTENCWRTLGTAVAGPGGRLDDIRRIFQRLPFGVRA